MPDLDKLLTAYYDKLEKVNDTFAAYAKLTQRCTRAVNDPSALNADSVEALQTEITAIKARLLDAWDLVGAKDADKAWDIEAKKIKAALKQQGHEIQEIMTDYARQQPQLCNALMERARSKIRQLFTEKQIKADPNLAAQLRSGDPAHFWQQRFKDAQSWFESTKVRLEAIIREQKPGWQTNPRRIQDCIAALDALTKQLASAAKRQAEAAARAKQAKPPPQPKAQLPQPQPPTSPLFVNPAEAAKFQPQK